MDSLPRLRSLSSHPLAQAVSTITPERTREIKALRDAFLRHPRSAFFLAEAPGLGTDIPWMLVECYSLESMVEGIIVAGTWENVALEWDLDEHFTVFHTMDREQGRFLGVNGWMFGSDDMTVLATLPGSGA